MLRTVTTLLVTVLVCAAVKAQDNYTIEESFKNFCSQKGYTCQSEDGFTRSFDEKNRLAELKKGQLTIQFAAYKRDNGSSLYVYSYFKDTCCGAPDITSACFEYENNTWKDVTAGVMPAWSFNDFYGPDVAPPSQYVNAVTYRYVLHKNNQLHVVVEPKGVKLDDKFVRVFEQRKYAAVQTKWNNNTGRFEIKKWLK